MIRCLVDQKATKGEGQGTLFPKLWQFTSDVSDLQKPYTDASHLQKLLLQVCEAGALGVLIGTPALDMLKEVAPARYKFPDLDIKLRNSQVKKPITPLYWLLCHAAGFNAPKNKEKMAKCEECGSLGKSGVPLMRCRVCTRVQYCGVECQKAHWKTHKGDCGACVANPTISLSGLKPICKKLIELKADPNYSDENGRNLLHVAASHVCAAHTPGVITYLLDLGVNASAKDASGEIAWYPAMRIYKGSCPKQWKDAVWQSLSQMIHQSGKHLPEAEVEFSQWKMRQDQEAKDRQYQELLQYSCQYQGYQTYRDDFYENEGSSFSQRNVACMSFPRGTWDGVDPEANYMTCNCEDCGQKRMRLLLGPLYFMHRWTWRNAKCWLGNPLLPTSLVATDNLAEIKRRTEEKWFHGLYDHDHMTLTYACLLHRKPEILEYVMEEIPIIRVAPDEDEEEDDEEYDEDGLRIRESWSGHRGDRFIDTAYVANRHIYFDKSSTEFSASIEDGPFAISSVICGKHKTIVAAQPIFYVFKQLTTVEMSGEDRIALSQCARLFEQNEGELRTEQFLVPGPSPLIPFIPAEQIHHYEGDAEKICKWWDTNGLPGKEVNAAREAFDVLMECFSVALDRDCSKHKHMLWGKSVEEQHKDSIVKAVLSMRNSRCVHSALHIVKQAIKQIECECCKENLWADFDTCECDVSPLFWYTARHLLDISKPWHKTVAEVLCQDDFPLTRAKIDYIDDEEKFSHGGTLLHVAAKSSGAHVIGVANALLQLKIDPTLEDNRGHTAWQLALQYEDFPLAAKLLRDKRCDIEVLNDEGFKFGSKYILRKLICGDDGAEELAKVLLQREWFPMHFPALLCTPKVADTLPAFSKMLTIFLEAGVDINERYPLKDWAKHGGMTTLFHDYNAEFARMSNSSEAKYSIFEWHCDYAETTKKKTHLPVIQALLDLKADPSVDLGDPLYSIIDRAQESFAALYEILGDSLPPVSEYTNDEIEAMSGSELKSVIIMGELEYDDCIEKSDFVLRAKQAAGLMSPAAGEGDDEAKKKKKRKNKSKKKKEKEDAQDQGQEDALSPEVLNDDEAAATAEEAPKLPLRERIHNRIQWLQQPEATGTDFTARVAECLLEEQRVCVLCEESIECCVCLGTSDYVVQTRLTDWDKKHTEEDPRLYLAVLASRARAKQLRRLRGLEVPPSPVIVAEPAEPPPETELFETQEEAEEEHTAADDEKDHEEPQPIPAEPVAMVAAREVNVDEEVSLDGLPWEVLIGPEAKETLFSKKLGGKLSRASLKKLRELAKGNWSAKTAKPLQGVPAWLNNKLFECYLTASIRIIWQKAIDFSPRLKRYTDTIRVWYIEMDHDNVSRRIDNVVRSLKRGRQSHVKRNLKLQANNIEDADGSTLHLPMYYDACDLEERDHAADEARQAAEEAANEAQGDDPEQQAYFPPAEVGRTNNYTILKFYAMSREFVQSVLWCAAHEKLDVPTNFPFSADEKEDYYIRLTPEPPRSIILVGRSGTGKTTISLHRMWALYHKHRELLEGTEAEGHFNQVFVTANTVLRSQVEKSFRSLQGHQAWNPKADRGAPDLLQVKKQDFPLFLTSKERLAALDMCLEGEHFLRPNEVGDRGSWYEEGDPLERLELEDEEEDEEEYGAAAAAEGDQPSGPAETQPPRRKVTYEFFVERLWPAMTRNSKSPYSPSAIFTEIFSYIKGSFAAVQKEEGRLSCEEYVDLPKKMASSFRADLQGVGGRLPVYELFERYEVAKAENRCYDSADLVFHIYSRIKAHGYNGPPIDNMVVDEVQDFTQAELLVFLEASYDKNQLFLTGDTCQTIARGVGFRFQDVRSMFHEANEAPGPWQGKVGVPTVEPLTVNYRTHTGILKCANSVVDIMNRFVGDTVDTLKKELAHFEGPRPFLLPHSTTEELCCLLASSVDETTTIEFGAHQAILVRSQEAKDRLPPEFDGALVLTIIEAKGLEFDDVIVYNFWQDSPAEEEWRCVTQHQLDRLTDPDDVERVEELQKLRPLRWDPHRHRVLGEELKYLYVAITRARKRLSFFDEDMEKRKPMFDFFESQQLVQVVSVLDGMDSEHVETEDPLAYGAERGFFDLAIKSSAEDWRMRGDNLFFRDPPLYSIAAECYRKSGDTQQERMATGHDLFRRAQREATPEGKAKLMMQASEALLEASQYDKAATCLYNAKQFLLAGDLFALCGEVDKAARSYNRLGKESNAKEEVTKWRLKAAGCYRDGGYLDKALVLFDKAEAHGNCLELLEANPEWIPTGTYTKEHFVVLQAKALAAKGEHTQAVAMLYKVEDPMKRVKMAKEYQDKDGVYGEIIVADLKASGEYQQAAEYLVARNRLRDALRAIDPGAPIPVDEEIKGDTAEVQNAIDSIMNKIEGWVESPGLLPDKLGFEARFAECSPKRLLICLQLLRKRGIEDDNASFLAEASMLASVVCSLYTESTAVSKLWHERWKTELEELGSALSGNALKVTATTAAMEAAGANCDGKALSTIRDIDDHCITPLGRVFALCLAKMHNPGNRAVLLEGLESQAAQFMSFWRAAVGRKKNKGRYETGAKKKLAAGDLVIIEGERGDSHPAWCQGLIKVTNQSPKEVTLAQAAQNGEMRVVSRQAGWFKKCKIWSTTPWWQGNPQSAKAWQEVLQYLKLAEQGALGQSLSGKLVVRPLNSTVDWFDQWLGRLGLPRLTITSSHGTRSVDEADLRQAVGRFMRHHLDELFQAVWKQETKETKGKGKKPPSKANDEKLLVQLQLLGHHQMVWAEYHEPAPNNPPEWHASHISRKLDEVRSYLYRADIAASRGGKVARPPVFSPESSHVAKVRAFAASLPAELQEKLDQGVLQDYTKASRCSKLYDVDFAIELVSQSSEASTNEAGRRRLIEAARKVDQNNKKVMQGQASGLTAVLQLVQAEKDCMAELLFDRCYSVWRIGVGDQGVKDFTAKVTHDEYPKHVILGGSIYLAAQHIQEFSEEWPSEGDVLRVKAKPGGKGKMPWMGFTVLATSYGAGADRLATVPPEETKLLDNTLEKSISLANAAALVEKAAMVCLVAFSAMQSKKDGSIRVLLPGVLQCRYFEASELFTNFGLTENFMERVAEDTLWFFQSMAQFANQKKGEPGLDRWLIVLSTFVLNHAAGTIHLEDAFLGTVLQSIRTLTQGLGGGDSLLPWDISHSDVNADKLVRELQAIIDTEFTPAEYKIDFEKLHGKMPDQIQTVSQELVQRSKKGKKQAKEHAKEILVFNSEETRLGTFKTKLVPNLDPPPALSTDEEVAAGEEEAGISGKEILEPADYPKPLSKSSLQMRQEQARRDEVCWDRLNSIIESIRRRQRHLSLHGFASWFSHWILDTRNALTSLTSACRAVNLRRTFIARESESEEGKSGAQKYIHDHDERVGYNHIGQFWLLAQHDSQCSICGQDHSGAISIPAASNPVHQQKLAQYDMYRTYFVDFVVPMLIEMQQIQNEIRELQNYLKSGESFLPPETAQQQAHHLVTLYNDVTVLWQTVMSEVTRTIMFRGWGSHENQLVAGLTRGQAPHWRDRLDTQKGMFATCRSTIQNGMAPTGEDEGAVEAPRSEEEGIFDNDAVGAAEALLELDDGEEMDIVLPKPQKGGGGGGGGGGNKKGWRRHNKGSGKKKKGGGEGQRGGNGGGAAQAAAAGGNGERQNRQRNGRQGRNH